MKINERLRELRLAKNETQLQVSMVVNISQEMVSRYELGKSVPDINTLVIFAEHFHVSVDYLLGLTDDKLPYTKSSLTNAEKELIFSFKQLNSIQKEKAKAYIDGMLGE